MVRNGCYPRVLFVHILCSTFHTSSHKQTSVIELPPATRSQIQILMEVQRGMWIA